MSNSKVNSKHHASLTSDAPTVSRTVRRLGSGRQAAGGRGREVSAWAKRTPGIVSRNKYGDIMVYADNVHMPGVRLRNIDRQFDMFNDKVTFVGFACPPPYSTLVSSISRLGSVYASPPLAEVYPAVKDGVILSSSGVVFIRQKDVVYSVHVQCRGRLKAVNPGGGRDPDETSMECAAREILEETGLSVDLDPDPITPHEYTTWYAGVNWKGQKTMYWGTAHTEGTILDGVELSDSDLTIIPYSDINGEVEHLTIIPVSILDRPDTANYVFEGDLESVREALAKYV